ncbi:MAG: tetratricopeptide repeat protein, partial [Anaerolineae bacterium]
MTEVTLEVYENEIDYMIEEARYLEAFAHLRHILEKYPRYVEAYYMLGKMMLETDLPQLAIDMFRRVLNADPEHLLARIGLGLAHERLDNTDAAIWNLERAFELDPGNEDLAQELARLYGRRSGVVPDHISLSRGGLARLYLRGNLYGRAANELREMVEEDDERVDLLTALAEALLRDDQIVQAADTCQRILDYFPYCLKANLLLGTLWLRSGQEEGEHYLRRAQEIDPRNELAQKIFGSSSPVEVKEVTIERLVYEPDALPVDSDAEWFKHLEAASVSAGISEAMPEMSDEEMRLVDITAGLESQIQIPDWLRELGPLAEEGEVPEWLEEEEVEAEELSSWLDTVAEAEEEGREIEEIPDWVEDLEPPEGAPGVVAEEEEEGIPDWMQQFQPSEEEEAEFEQTPEEEEMPDWMRGLGPAVEAAPPPVDEETLEEEEMPDWMRELQPTDEAAPPVEEEAPEEEEVPDWMRELQPAAEAAPPV